MSRALHRDAERQLQHPAHGATPHATPGKRTLSEAWPATRSRAPVSRAPVQLRATGAPPATMASLFGTVRVAAPGGPSPLQPIARGGGERLPAAVQAKMERSFGADFGGVQIHAASGQASALGAQAFAYGDDLHFAPGSYQPATPAGQELLGHELAHVVQQRAGRVAASGQARGVAINQDAALEHEADEQGARAARGEPAGASASGGAVATPVAQGVWLCTRAQGTYELPGDTPPPWLGLHYYYFQGVYYPAHEYPELKGYAWDWSYPLEQEPVQEPVQEQVEVEVEVEQPRKQQQPKQPDPDVLEAEALVNKTPRMSALAKKPLLRFLQAAKDAGGLQVILDTRQGHIDRKIIGFESWFRRVLKCEGVGNYLFELREALRLVKQDDRPVQIDNDSIEGGSGNASIDLFVLRNRDESIVRSVEVMGYPEPLVSYEAFFEGVRQGADHLISKLQRNARSGGLLEATVAMAFVPEHDYTGWVKRACLDLVNLSGNALIDRINLVSRDDGKRHAKLVRHSKVWQME